MKWMVYRRPLHSIILINACLCAHFTMTPNKFSAFSSYNEEKYKDRMNYLSLRKMQQTNR